MHFDNDIIQKTLMNIDAANNDVPGATVPGMPKMLYL